MTHHATNLDLPSEANITTAAGDVAVFQSTGSNTVQCISYTKADGTAVVAAASGFTQGTEQATTTGTSFTFGSIPAGVDMIVINFFGVSFTSGIPVDVTLGDSGGLETSGYLSMGGKIATSTASVLASTAAFEIMRDAAGDNLDGSLVLTLENATSFNWCAHWTMRASTTISSWGGGTKSLSGELTQLSLSGGTFDAGAVNIMYQ